MKSLKYIFVLSCITVLFSACKDNQQAPEVKTVTVEASQEKTLDPNATYAKAEFNIKGMTCAMGCAKTIEKKLAKMDGVKSAKVDFDTQLAMVEYDVAAVNPGTLEETVKNTGEVYSVENMKTVDAFSTETACKPDCKKACCANKEGASNEKMACAKDCKKACCAKESQA